jgi:hypothetical protein
MFTVKPWREIAEPHEDVLKGTFQQAESDTGFDDGLQRAVKENCKVLRFKNAEFESSQG